MKNMRGKNEKNEKISKWKKKMKNEKIFNEKEIALLGLIMWTECHIEGFVFVYRLFISFLGQQVNDGKDCDSKKSGTSQDRYAEGDEPPARKPCKCSVSHCLKLYCDCFNAGELCGSACICKDCSNTPDKAEERATAVATALKRNPSAFLPKVAAVTEEGSNADRSHVRGCHCRKSECLKNYCECYLVRGHFSNG